MLDAEVQQPSVSHGAGSSAVGTLRFSTTHEPRLIGQICRVGFEPTVRLSVSQCTETEGLVSHTPAVLCVYLSELASREAVAVKDGRVCANQDWPSLTRTVAGTATVPQAAATQ